MSIAIVDGAECRCLLADGRVLTVAATRRPRAGRADVKCAIAGAPALGERMQEVVRLARHTELRLDSRDQVVLSMDGQPAFGERDWELAAVLADRLVRGVLHSPAPKGVFLFAQGWSDAWHLGRVDGSPSLALSRLQAAKNNAYAIVGGDDGAAALDGSLPIAHLGALTGHADPAAAVSSARAWFPLHSGGINDSLGWLEVSVFPLPPGEQGEEDASIAAPGLDPVALLGLRQALAGARHFDGAAPGRWRTVVRFGQPRFQGRSYELALVMADRLARGREWVPRGRLIASGCSSAWHAGQVDGVEGREPKTALILGLAGIGDRVLLPKAWQAQDAAASAVFAAGLKARGASVAWVERIGLL